MELERESLQSRFSRYMNWGADKGWNGSGGGQGKSPRPPAKIQGGFFRRKQEKVSVRNKVQQVPVWKRNKIKTGG